MPRQKRIVGRRRILKQVAVTGKVRRFEDGECGWWLKIRRQDNPVNMQGGGLPTMARAQRELRRQIQQQLG